MLGKGLESLIPSGGFKKPDDGQREKHGEQSDFLRQNRNQDEGPLEGPTAFDPQFSNYNRQFPVPNRQVENPNPQERPFAPYDPRQFSSDRPFVPDSVNPPVTPLVEPEKRPNREYIARQPQASPINGGSQPQPENDSQRYAVNERQSFSSEQSSRISAVPAFSYGTERVLMEKAMKEDISDYSRKQSSVFQIEVEKIFPNPHQPRRYFDEDALNDLANSIREFGIIQPLVVTKIQKETDSGTDVSYQLIAGERRLIAAKKVGLRTVPAIIKQIRMDRERLELSIIENIQRENLNPLESARSYAKLQDEFGLTQREIAARMGKSRETIANTLRLLSLPTEIQRALEGGKINESHARLLLQIGDISRQKEMLQSILHSKPSVRELKTKIKNEKGTAAGNYLNPELISLQSKLEESLGTKVQISDEGNKGKITINYYSSEELDALINRISGGERY